MPRAFASLKAMRPLPRSLVVLALALVATAAGAATLPVYVDQVADGWEYWGWASVVNLAYTGTVHGGTHAIRFEPDAWEAVYLHSAAALSVAEWNGVRFWVRGEGSGGQSLVLWVRLGSTTRLSTALAPYLPAGGVPAGQWAQVTVPFADFGVTSGSFDDLWIQAGVAGDQAAVLVDDWELTGPGPIVPPGGPVPVAVDPGADRRYVSPLVYGVNFGDIARFSTVPYTVRRYGGNSTTRYNWQADVHSTASDWFFMNIPDSSSPGGLPAGSSSDQFVAETLAGGSQVVLTVPTIGWAPAPVQAKRWSFSEVKYGPQTSDECRYFGNNPPDWCTHDAGNGLCDSAVNTTGYCQGGRIVGNDPFDTSIAITPAWVGDWIDFLGGRYGSAAQGGVRFVALDNEAMLWNSTHRDVHPTAPGYDEVWTRGLAVASEVRQRDPSVKILGPVTWGWCDLFSSAADAEVGPSCIDGADRQAHGGVEFVRWYLRQACAHERTTGVRVLDLLDVHYYPQASVAGLGGNDSGEDASTSARRLRSLRELWDPTYVSESWIGEAPYLLPRLRAWIDQECPGVGLALTEYKWGPDTGASGTLAQAELLAILGREGVELATRWVAPEVGTKVEQAFLLFLDYDAAGSRVAGDSVRAKSLAPDAVASYALRDPRGRLFLLLFNKDTVDREAQVTVAGGVTGNLALYRFTATTALAAAGTVPGAAPPIVLTLPPRSAALAVGQLAGGGGLPFSDSFERGLARWVGP